MAKAGGPSHAEGAAPSKLGRRADPRLHPSCENLMMFGGSTLQCCHQGAGRDVSETGRWADSSQWVGGTRVRMQCRGHRAMLRPEPGCEPAGGGGREGGGGGGLGDVAVRQAGRWMQVWVESQLPHAVPLVRRRPAGGGSQGRKEGSRSFHRSVAHRAVESTAGWLRQRPLKAAAPQSGSCVGEPAYGALQVKSS